ncbi:MAG TPA: putative collagen-binding domain-containing protein [Prolixibacteraceae bacterium]|nr:putative collagen-binding domain-containing protein [Prolixibacteraceae bacterium]
MRKTSILLLLCLVGLNLNTAFAQVKPITFHPGNPHYFSFKGKPTILITSGEHYGAVMNPDFDYRKYLETLQKDGLNLTRTMTGAYFEPAGAFNISKNTLAPDGLKYLCPWVQVEKGLKFDLDRWDKAYFVRLKDFVAEAQKRGVIVELSLFCPFYEEMQWELSPFNIKNNVNGLGAIPRTDVYTLDKNKGLLAVQEKMVRKVVEELKGFPNLIYEICNEPYFGGITIEWQNRIAQVITDAEKSFRNQHLISQNIGNGFQKIQEPNPLVSVFNFHYATPPKAVTLNFDLNKVIGENETGFNGQKDSTYRKEAWELILAGGGLFNNLDYSFTTDNEDGTFQYPGAQPGGGTPAYRRQLSYLKKFIESFNFVAMKPDTTVYAGGLTGKNNVYVLAETGKQYAIYWMSGKQVQLELNLPKGNYSLEWMNPLSGKYEKKITLNHAGGKAKLESPSYSEDFSLRILNLN